MVRLTDLPDMTMDVYRGRKTTTQQQQVINQNVKKGLNVILVIYFSICTATTSFIET